MAPTPVSLHQQQLDGQLLGSPRLAGRLRPGRLQLHVPSGGRHARLGVGQRRQRTVLGDRAQPHDRRAVDLEPVGGLRDGGLAASPSPPVARLARAARPHPGPGDPSRPGRLARHPPRPPAANPADVPALGDGHRPPAQTRAATAVHHPGRRRWRLHPVRPAAHPGARAVRHPAAAGRSPARQPADRHQPRCPLAGSRPAGRPAAARQHPGSTGPRPRRRRPGRPDRRAARVPVTGGGGSGPRRRRLPGPRASARRRPLSSRPARRSGAPDRCPAGPTARRR